MNALRVGFRREDQNECLVLVSLRLSQRLCVSAGRSCSRTPCYSRGMGPFGLCRMAAALCFLAALPAADFTTYIGDTNDYRVARVMADRKSTRLNSSHLGISYAVF